MRVNAPSGSGCRARPSAGGYQQKTFSLTAYAGQTVTLRFLGNEDNSRETNFVVDDTAVNTS